MVEDNICYFMRLIVCVLSSTDDAICLLIMYMPLQKQPGEHALKLQKTEEGADDMVCIGV